VRHWFLILLVFVLGTSTGLAQVDRATLVGTVTDPSGAVVPSAKVVITAPDTGLRREMQTGASGNYAFTGLPIGNYTVLVSASGFSNVSFKDVRLGVGDNRTLDVTLEVAGGAVAITVEG